MLKKKNKKRTRKQEDKTKQKSNKKLFISEGFRSAAAYICMRIFNFITAISV